MHCWTREVQRASCWITCRGKLATYHSSACDAWRRSGSAAFDLVWVACGRIDAYYEEGTKAWDICAGKLIAIEAGADHGFFDDNLKNELSEIRGYAILTANPSVFPELLTILDIRSDKE